MRMTGLLALATIAGLAVPAPAADPFDAAAAFGAREEVHDVSLSPDGKLLALVRALPGKNERVEIVPISGGAPQPVLVGAVGQRLTGCDWTSATRLLCRVYIIGEYEKGMLAGFTRLFAVDADGRNLRTVEVQSTRALNFVQFGGRVADLLPNESNGTVLITRKVADEFSTGTRMAEQRNGLALERLDTRTLARRYVETPRVNAVEYITDGYGNVRIIGERTPTPAGYVGNSVTYCFRMASARDCRPLSVVTEDAGFDPYAVDRALNVAYGFEKVGGRRVLVSVALDGSGRRETILSDPKVDIDRLIRIGRARRVVGASFANEKRQIVMFDPALKKLAASLSRALPKLPNVTFIDASADENKLLLIAGSDVEPGRYYLYDKTSRELNELVSVRPDLATVKLAEVKSVVYPAADGTAIPGYLTLPPGRDPKGLPAIVMPHGGPGARDEWGFDWWAQYFANRGFAVLQPNFRGSTGYGDAWYRENGFKSWRTAIGDVNDAGRWLLAQGIAAPGKLGIVGWSYGGYAALQSAVVDPQLFKAIVAVAPVTDLESLREESAAFTNYRLVDAYIGRGPHVREGSPAQNAGRIVAPVLIFSGDRDLNVNVRESRLMADRLKAAGRQPELVVYPGLDHQLEDSSARADMLRKSDVFLRKSLGL